MDGQEAVILVVAIAVYIIYFLYIVIFGGIFAKQKILEVSEQVHTTLGGIKNPIVA